jgi:hypothetical protein
VLSFLLLVFFGIRLLYANRREIDDAQARNGNRLALLGAGGFLALWGLSVIATWLVSRPERLPMINAADVLARYTLGVTGALIAAWAIWLEQGVFRRRGMGGFGRALLGAAAALFIYAIAQVFTQPSFFFPSTVLNADLFLRLFGFPVQVLRAAMAILMAVFIIRALNVFDIENEQRLAEARAARNAAREEALRVQAAARAETEQLNHQLVGRRPGPGPALHHFAPHGGHARPGAAAGRRRAPAGRRAAPGQRRHAGPVARLRRAAGHRLRRRMQRPDRAGGRAQGPGATTGRLHHRHRPTVVDARPHRSAVADCPAATSPRPTLPPTRLGWQR